MEPDARCQRIREILPDYSTGMGSFVFKAKVRAHLGRCPACAAELKAIEEACALVENLPLQHAPDRWSAIQPRLERRPSGKPQFAYRIKPAFAGAVALAAAAIVISGSPGPQHRPEANTDMYSSTHAIMSWNQPFADTAELGMVPSVPSDTSTEAAK
jgi:anti-sigma factor RsiW